MNSYKGLRNLAAAFIIISIIGIAACMLGIIAAFMLDVGNDGLIYACIIGIIASLFLYGFAKLIDLFINIAIDINKISNQKQQP